MLLGDMLSFLNCRLSQVIGAAQLSINRYCIFSYNCIKLKINWLLEHSIICLYYVST